MSTSTGSRTVLCGLDMEYVMPSPSGSETNYAPMIKELADHLVSHGGRIPVAARCTHDKLCTYDELYCNICHDVDPDQCLERDIVSFKPAVGDSSAWARRFPTEYRFFLIKQENRVQVQYRRGPLRAIQITSPVFRRKDIDDRLRPLEKLLTACKQMPVTSFNYDQSCGLHLSTSLLRGIHLDDAKRMVTLILILEQPLLRSIIPHHRRVSPFGAAIDMASEFGRGTYGACKAEDTPEMLAHLPWGNQDPPPGFWNRNQTIVFRRLLRKVWHSPSLEHLAKGLCLLSRGEFQPLGFGIRLRDPRGLPLPFDRIDDETSDDFSRSTFVFRYPTMSVEHEYFLCWCDLCSKMTEMAGLPADDFKAWVDRIVNAMVRFDKDNKDLQVKEEDDLPPPRARVVLESMRLGHLITSWAQAMASNPSSRPISDW
ncbi:hypothetical protein XA68_11270 [Ophiocordyceps unilateralis]|uniref:Uncharacterized protein n=1 Tax=Ophiocordyceps unilateralis TaxID=268505 RepID=A0A2A9PH65_OPHUN|nr:hypothetical protein XA68_11270 [Ophiocordyceps unilateralis]